MDQVSLTFIPALLFVRTGERVEFRNSDDTLHNVHVGNAETKEPSFNVAIPTGESYSYTFQSDGFYHVTCDIHPAMSADIISSSTPFATMADGEGSFGFADVPPGDYVLREYLGKSKKETTVQIKPGMNTLAAGAAKNSGEDGE
jgi:Copper binding proteins, plastocyanin/azurin family